MDPPTVALVLPVVYTGGGGGVLWKTLSTELSYCTQWTVCISVCSVQYTVLLCINKFKNIHRNLGTLLTHC